MFDDSLLIYVPLLKFNQTSGNNFEEPFIMLYPCQILQIN